MCNKSDNSEEQSRREKRKEAFEAFIPLVKDRIRDIRDSAKRVKENFKEDVKN